LYRKLEARFRPEKVLLFGSGGREHEIARRLLDSPNLRALHWAPGQDAGFEQLRAIVAKTANGARKNLVRWDGMGWPGTDLPPAEREERIKKLIVKARDAGITL